MEREYLVPGSTPVRAVRAVWDADKPGSQLRLETATRLSVNDIDRRAITVLPRELKWLYEHTTGKATKSNESESPGPKVVSVVVEQLQKENEQLRTRVVELEKANLAKKPGPKPAPPVDAVSKTTMESKVGQANTQSGSG